MIPFADSFPTIKSLGAMQRHEQWLAHTTAFAVLYLLLHQSYDNITNTIDAHKALSNVKGRINHYCPRKGEKLLLDSWRTAVPNARECLRNF